MLSNKKGNDKKKHDENASPSPSRSRSRSRNRNNDDDDIKEDPMVERLKEAVAIKKNNLLDSHENLAMEDSYTIYKGTGKCEYGDKSKNFGKGAYYETMSAIAMGGFVWRCRLYPNGKDGGNLGFSHVGVQLMNAFEAINA